MSLRKVVESMDAGSEALCAAKIRREFLKLLTQNSETHDMRRKEYNQAIFNPEGWAVFNGTDLNMVMDKFDHAVKNLDKRTPPPV